MDGEFSDLSEDLLRDYECFSSDDDDRGKKSQMKSKSDLAPFDKEESQPQRLLTRG